MRRVADILTWVGVVATAPARFVIEPTLHYLDPEVPFSDAAVEQVLGTGLAESGLSRLAQQGGPALGVFQIEPATESDCWANYLNDRAPLRLKVQALLGSEHCSPALIVNLSYATAICRIVYRRSPLPLAAVGDRQGQGALWVRAYNRGGAATVERYVTAWKEGVG